MGALRNSYTRYMDQAESTWAHAITALERATGLPWSVWQTGGGCLALGCVLGDPDDEDYPYLMLTDNDGPIPVDRYTDTDYDNNYLDNLNWALGIYAGQEDEEPIMVTSLGWVGRSKTASGATFGGARPHVQEDDPVMAEAVANVLDTCRKVPTLDLA